MTVRLTLASCLFGALMACSPEDDDWPNHIEVSGRVLLADGSPASGVKVTFPFESCFFLSCEDQSIVATTNARGEYVLLVHDFLKGETRSISVKWVDPTLKVIVRFPLSRDEIDVPPIRYWYAAPTLDLRGQADEELLVVDWDTPDFDSMSMTGEWWRATQLEPEFLGDGMSRITVWEGAKGEPVPSKVLNGFDLDPLEVVSAAAVTSAGIVFTYQWIGATESPFNPYPLPVSESAFSCTFYQEGELQPGSGILEDGEVNLGPPSDWVACAFDEPTTVSTIAWYRGSFAEPRFEPTTVPHSEEVFVFDTPALPSRRNWGKPVAETIGDSAYVTLDPIANVRWVVIAPKKFEKDAEHISEVRMW